SPSFSLIYTHYLHDALPIFIRLADQGHNVHVAYQTSGNTAVWDDDVLRYLEFVQDFAVAIDDDNGVTTNIYNEAKEFFKTKQPRSEEHTSELQSREKLVCRL